MALTLARRGLAVAEGGTGTGTVSIEIWRIDDVCTWGRVLPGGMLRASTAMSRSCRKNGHVRNGISAEGACLV
jgi:hypothetical protein